jgi:hypothetical protein
VVYLKNDVAAEKHRVVLEVFWRLQQVQHKHLEGYVANNVSRLLVCNGTSNTHFRLSLLNGFVSRGHLVMKDGVQKFPKVEIRREWLLLAIPTAPKN